MRNHRTAESDRDVLTEPAAARLLTRAAELDASRAAGFAVPDLRAAAVEAGISPGAFDEAFAELHELKPVRVSDMPEQPRRRSRRWVGRGLGAALIAAVALVVLERSFLRHPVPSVPMVEEAVLVQCGSAGEAAELIRPLLRLPSNTVVIPGHAPRVLRIRGTPEQLQEVKTTLAKYESAGAAACTTAPARVNQ